VAGVQRRSGVSTVVSARLAGVGVCEERTSTLVPVLEMSMVRLPTKVGFGSCNINPTPIFKLGNGTGSV
jgi:hypothetical protein